MSLPPCSSRVVPCDTTERGSLPRGWSVSSALARRVGMDILLCVARNVPDPRGRDAPSDPGPSDPGLPTHYDSGWFDSFSRQFAVDYIWTGDARRACSTSSTRGIAVPRTGARPTVLLDGGAGRPVFKGEAVQEVSPRSSRGGLRARSRRGPAAPPAGKLGRAGAILNPRAPAKDPGIPVPRPTPKGAWFWAGSGKPTIINWTRRRTRRRTRGGSSRRTRTGRSRSFTRRSRGSL